MRTIAELLPEHPFFEGLDEQWIDLMTGCASNTHLSPGAWVFREGEPADTFYVVRRGCVAIETPTPTGPLVIQTAHEGDVVGWSWLVPPYRWTFDARATEETSLIAFDGACLRGKCEGDPALGYALMQRVVQVMSDRLHSARMRMLDLYGAPS
ncbi:cyclic nucleotide-binding domain-containing protein [Nocardioides sp. YIM 152588]|uniref:Crp/Fnr family transcriptional regulator n=1 Tax=Nocardioides sp. YIM 152588 TaxID=3158259 RepID=UPI0032E3E6DD